MSDVQPVPYLVKVIDRAALIENMFNQAISEYCKPRAEASFFMWSVVLDTSVMSLSAKLKVVMAIAHYLNYTLSKEPFMKVIQLRNSFAHHPTDAHPVLVVGVEPDEGSSYTQFWTLDSNGIVQSSKQHEAFDLFNVNYQLARDSLRDFLKVIREDVANSTGQQRMKYPVEKPAKKPK